MKVLEQNLAGIIQPNFRNNKYKFTLVNDRMALPIEVPRTLLEILKKHLWERVSVRGVLTNDKIFYVKSIRLENEDIPALQDRSKSFDIETFRRAIHKGFSLEPLLQETA